MMRPRRRPARARLRAPRPVRVVIEYPDGTRREIRDRSLREAIALAAAHVEPAG